MYVSVQILIILEQKERNIFEMRLNLYQMKLSEILYAMSRLKNMSLKNMSFNYFLRH